MSPMTSEVVRRDSRTQRRITKDSVRVLQDRCRRMQKLLITLLHIASWAGSAYAHRPPLGATYRRTVSLPVIGTQTVVRLAQIAQTQA